MDFATFDYHKLAAALGPTIERSIEKHVTATLGQQFQSPGPVHAAAPFTAQTDSSGMHNGHTDDVIVCKKETLEVILGGLEMLSAEQLVMILKKLGMTPPESERTEKQALSVTVTTELRSQLLAPMQHSQVAALPNQEWTRSPDITEGTAVLIRGLSNGAYNGMMGCCQSFDAAKDRWQVRLQGLQGDQIIAVKAENLVPQGSVETWEATNIDSSGASERTQHVAGEPSSVQPRFREEEEEESFSEEVAKADLVLVKSRDQQGIVVDVDMETSSCTVKLADGREVDTMWSGVVKLGRKDAGAWQAKTQPYAIQPEEHIPKCPICQRAVDAGDIRKLKCNCDTWLHAEPCLRQFLGQENPVCPTCRAPQPSARPQSQASVPANNRDRSRNRSSRNLSSDENNSNSEGNRGSSDEDPFREYEAIDPREFVRQYGRWPHLIPGQPPTPNNLRPSQRRPWGPRRQQNRGDFNSEEMSDVMGEMFETMLGFGDPRRMPQNRVRGFHYRG